MNVEIQKLEKQARLPEYAHPGDAGMDVFAFENLALEPGERGMVRTGVAMKVPEGYVGLVWDKSGRAVKEGLTTMAGVIDSGYRGEVQIVILNTSTEAITIEAGQKVAQILIQPVICAMIQEVSQLDDTSRGDNGFGSTGL